MPKNLPSQDSSQQRASKLLLAMGVIVLLHHERTAQVVDRL